jgi:hypothetical protein
MSTDQWRLALPDGQILLFDDWHTAHIEASLREYTLGLPLIPERITPEPASGTEPKETAARQGQTRT